MRPWTQRKGCPLIAVILLFAAVVMPSPRGTAIAEERLVEKSEEAPAVPSANKLRILIRTTVVALSQAGQTGNYTVLRDLGAPGFQSANSAARLSELFKQLRDQALDLGPVVLIEPKLTKAPQINERGHLRVTGFFPSQPKQVNFDLAFQMVGEEWRVFGLGVTVAPVRVAAKSQEPKKNEVPNAKSPVKKKGQPLQAKPAVSQAAQQPPVDPPFRAEAAPPAEDKKAGWNPFN